MPEPQDTPLYVRLPADTADRLHRAAAALPARKKDIVAGLVARYVDPETSAGIEALRALATPQRVVVTTGEPTPVVGHHSFLPAAAPEVLTLTETADLLSVGEADVVALAEAGELPGRQIGGSWRFARRAVLDWLGGA